MPAPRPSLHLLDVGPPCRPSPGGRLALGPWVPDRWPLDPLSASFAVARLGEPSQTLLVARARGPLFRARELQDLEQLAKIAATLGDGRLAPS